MTRKQIPNKTKLQIWTKSGGRCQFKGCNKNLLRDDLTFSEMNNAHIAHIIDVNKKTHRYSENYSEEQKNEIWNLMLLCQKHHRLIDNEEEENYSVEKLKKYKREHENRILNLTSIKGDVKTKIICYLTRIGKFQPNVSFETIKEILSQRNLFPNSEPIDIGTRNSTLEDNDDLYWKVEEKNLVKDFEKKVLKHFDQNSGNHFSLFALAPQPLLIRLGTLIPDIYTVDVYQKHREPDTWKWQNGKMIFNGFKIIKPATNNGIPVLIIALSAEVIENRITSVLDGNLSIWKLTIDLPNNNFLTHKEILEEFRVVVRKLLNKIKAEYGHSNSLKVFPCMPNSASVEFGRVWMPKADLDLEIYDERNGFKSALLIKKD